MIDAKMTFAQVDVAPAKRGKRMAPLLGLGLGAVVSMGLWAVLVATATRIF
jgi:hypothetical protein